MPINGGQINETWVWRTKMGVYFTKLTSDLSKTNLKENIKHKQWKYDVNTDSSKLLYERKLHTKNFWQRRDYWAIKCHI